MARSHVRLAVTPGTTLVLAGGVASAILFVAIADDVLDGEATRLDDGVARSLHAVHSPALEASMRVVTHLGSTAALAVVMVAVAAWAWLRRSRALAGLLVAVALVTEALTWSLKALVRRDRPDAFLADVVPLTTFAFPSAHAMVSTAVYGTAAIVAARLRPSLAPLLWVLTPLLVLAIGLSRIVLGVHWPTDVLAGFAAGGLILAAASLAARNLDP